MITITSLRSRQILDSRGNPTVECDVLLSDGAIGRAAVPSGASTGSREALELRDGDASKYGGKSVGNALRHIQDDLAPVLIGADPFDQRQIDARMCELDGTPNKATMGANSILAVSLATAKACAVSSGLALHDYIASIAGTSQQQSLPMPMMNIMNGGKHALGATDFQEYMIIPVGADSIESAVEMGANVFHTLATILQEAGYPTTVGDEGGYAPAVKQGNREPLDHIVAAIERAGYQPGVDIALAMDVAASEFYIDGQYHLASEDRTLDASGLIEYYRELRRDYPIISIEDGLDESDWEGWSRLMHELGSELQLVGDDLLVTNTQLLQKGIDEHAANSILIKPNQIG